MGKAKRTFYHFTAAIDPSGIEADLVKYLKRKGEVLTEKDKVLGAVLTHWFPFILRETRACNDAELKQHALATIYRLQQHINYIARSFAIEDVTILTHPTTAETTLEAIPSPREPEKTLGQNPGLNLPTSPSDLVHHPEDEDYESMFN